MSSRRRSRRDARLARAVDGGYFQAAYRSALEENVQEIKRWERGILLARSKAEQVSDWIAYTAGRGPVLALYVVWFGFWVGLNVGMLRGSRPFDPFSFSLPNDDRLARGHLPSCSSWPARTGSLARLTRAVISTCRTTGSPHQK